MSLQSPIYFEHVTSVDSTMNFARKWVQRAIEENRIHAVLADAQTQGRGRQGRVWLSPMGGVYLSIVVPVQSSVQPFMGQASLIASLALVRVLRDAILDPMSAKKIVCKWPNDILVDHKKLAGILIEYARRHEEEMGALILGVGINIAPVSLKKHDKNQAIGLEELEPSTVVKSILVARVLEEFQKYFSAWDPSGFEKLSHEWLERSIQVGSRMSVHQGRQVLHGFFAGIDAQGALRLKVDGREVIITAGDAVLHTSKDNGHCL